MISGERMRILFLQDHLRIGGTEKQTLALTRYGQENGYQTGLLVFRPGGRLSVSADPSFFYKTLQPFNTGIDEWAPGLIGKIESFAPDALVFMVKVTHLYLEKLKQRFPEVSMIATFRSGKPPAPYYRRALGAAHGILTNNYAEEARLTQKNKSSAKKIHTVHNGCLLPMELQVSLSKPGDTLRILCVAMFRPQKNQAELITILSKLPASLSWRCTLAGTGKTLNSSKVLAKSLNLEERVRFVSTSHPQSLYETHDIAVSTSDKEGLPNSLIEAQWAGLPVVAYLVNGVGECFEESVSGFGVPFGDQLAFLDALQLLSTNTARRQEMSEAAKRVSSERFNFEDRSRDFFQIIQQLHDARGQKKLH